MTKKYFEYEGTKYDVTFGKSDIVRHGGPFDRGSADSYYERWYDPHYFVGGTYMSPRVGKEQMTAEEIKQYDAGWAYNDMLGEYKDWG